MRAHWFVAAAVLIVFGLVPTLQADPTGMTGHVVSIDVVDDPRLEDHPDDPYGDVESCEGTAPADHHCVRSFELVEGRFVVRQSFGVDYTGGFINRWSTATGSGQTVCVKYSGFAPVCQDSVGGVFAEGQQMTLEVIAPASGYWRVSVHGGP